MLIRLRALRHEIHHYWVNSCNSKYNYSELKTEIKIKIKYFN